MSGALAAISQEAGAWLGSLLSGLAGIAGLFLIQNRRMTTRFQDPQAIINSSELVRGVVAGPTNVAIASVGDNLKNALVGVEGRLDVTNQLLAAIRLAMGGGGGAGGPVSTPLAGSVPTT